MLVRLLAKGIHMTYFSVLKKRGYKPYMINRTACVYIKNHKCNVGTITILKDSHCKGKTLLYEIKQIVKDNGENLSDFHKGYLEKEAEYILREFEKLRERVKNR